MDEKSIELYRQNGQAAVQNAHEMLLGLQQRHAKAKQHFKDLMEKVKNGMNDDLYLTFTKELKRYSKTKRNFNEERSPFTSAIQELVKPFTTIENDFDPKKEGSMAYEIKRVVDGYAVKKAAEEEKRKKELLAKVNKEKEINEVKIKTERFINKIFAQISSEIKSKIDALLNSITLENYKSVREEIITLDTSVPESVFSGFDVEVQTIYIGKDDKEGIFFSLKNSERYKQIKNGFDNEVMLYQQDAVSKIQAILNELEEIQKSDEKEKKRLLEEKRKREEEEEARKKKEEQERLAKIEKEAKEQEELNELQSSFDFGLEAASVESVGVKKKEEVVIELVLPFGIAEIVKFWLEQEKPTDIDAAKRWTVDRMIRLAEKEANKTGNRIVSKYVIYKTKVTAKV